MGRFAKEMAKKKADEMARVAVAKEREKIGRVGLGIAANDVGSRAKLINKTWEVLEKATRVVWQPFATLEAEAPAGRKVVVQLVTSRKVLPCRMLNFCGLDSIMFRRTASFLKNRIALAHAVSKSSPRKGATGFIALEVRKENVAKWLEAYFKQVGDMSSDFRLAVIELFSESPYPRSRHAAASHNRQSLSP